MKCPYDQIVLLVNVRLKQAFLKENIYKNDKISYNLTENAFVLRRKAREREICRIYGA